MEKFIEFREKYHSIIYKDYTIIKTTEFLDIEFLFQIPALANFRPKLSIPKEFITNNDINNDFLNLIVFNIGMIELISYYKCVCPKKIVVEAGYLDEKQKAWFKKLYYYGLGEFLYINNIDISMDDLFDFEIKGKKISINKLNYSGIGNLIPIGGGKDSIVTLELLKDYKDQNSCFIINPKQVSLDCCNVASYSPSDIYCVKRIIDKRLLELNAEGYLNGHTPFSSIVAFVSYLVAYLNNKKYIVLSNENSANESTVKDSFVNHQYSKSYEFEKDFRDYVHEYLDDGIEYFSLLRSLKEIQIAMLFSKYKKYYMNFKSCNLGSKNENWNWCGKCPKCLFVYIILSPFLNVSQLIDIFGNNLLDDKTLEESFLELIGKKQTKPFECVGTISEVIFSLNEYIKKNKDLPYLVQLYKDEFYEEIEINLKEIDDNHFIPFEYLKILEEAINNA